IMRYQYTSLIKFRKGKHVNLIKYEDFTEGKFPMLEEAGIMNRGLGNIDLHKISEKLFSREELSKHKRKNKKTVDGSNSGKWKQDLPKRTVFLMELMFNDYFEQFEYERRFKGKIISMANKIVRVIFLVTYPVYHVIS